jgi:hypothetical protein
MLMRSPGGAEDAMRLRMLELNFLGPGHHIPCPRRKPSLAAITIESWQHRELGLLL